MLATWVRAANTSEDRRSWGPGVWRETISLENLLNGEARGTPAAGHEALGAVGVQQVASP